MPVKATSSPSEKLTEIQDALKLRQVKLQQLVEQEEYQQVSCFLVLIDLIGTCRTGL